MPQFLRISYESKHGKPFFCVDGPGHEMWDIDAELVDTNCNEWATEILANTKATIESIDSIIEHAKEQILLDDTMFWASRGIALYMIMMRDPGMSLIISKDKFIELSNILFSRLRPFKIDQSKSPMSWLCAS